MVNIVNNTDIKGYIVKTYPEPPKITEMEADLMANGWVRGFLLATRKEYLLFGLRYGGGGLDDADLLVHIRPLDWLPHNPASPYCRTQIFTVRKHRKVAEDLEEGDILLVNDLYDDEVYILSQVDLPPQGTVHQTERLTLQVKGLWFHRNAVHPLLNNPNYKSNRPSEA